MKQTLKEIEKKRKTRENAFSVMLFLALVFLVLFILALNGYNSLQNDLNYCEGNKERVPVYLENCYDVAGEKGAFDLSWLPYNSSKYHYFFLDKSNISHGRICEVMN